MRSKNYFSKNLLFKATTITKPHEWVDTRYWSVSIELNNIITNHKSLATICCRSVTTSRKVCPLAKPDIGLSILISMSEAHLCCYLHAHARRVGSSKKCSTLPASPCLCMDAVELRHLIIASFSLSLTRLGSVVQAKIIHLFPGGIRGRLPASSSLWLSPLLGCFYQAAMPSLTSFSCFHKRSSLAFPCQLSLALSYNYTYTVTNQPTVSLNDGLLETWLRFFLLRCLYCK